MDEDESKGELTRREFLGLGALAGGALGSLYFLQPDREKTGRLYAALTPEQERKLGVEEWYPTACGECPGGCSLLVRVMEGRAKVVQGNPLSSVNGTNTCTRGQASVQGLYNPDRVQQPLRRRGQSLVPISWQKAMNNIGPVVKQARKNDACLLVSRPVRGHMKWLMQEAGQWLGGREPVFWEAYKETSHREAVREVLGLDRLPYRDIENADCLVTFGARFLETWLSPVQFSRAYGRFRQGDAGSPSGRKQGRGIHLHVEPRMSTTAANADHWLPVKPGTEGLLAQYIAYRISEQRSGTIPGDWKSMIKPIERKEVVSRCDVPERKMKKLEDTLRDSTRPLFIGGGNSGAYTDGSRTLAWVESLNVLAENLDQAGGIQANPPSLLSELDRFKQEPTNQSESKKTAGFQRLEALGQSILEKETQISCLVVHDLDIIHQLPSGSNFRRAIQNVETIVHLSSYPNDTARVADYVLPIHTPLERWDDDVPEPAPGERSYSFGQPVVSPYYDTRHPGTVLLQLSRGANVDVPWERFEDLLKEDLKELYKQNRGRLSGLTFGQFKEGLTAKGGWFSSEESEVVGPPEAKPESFEAEAPSTILTGSDDLDKEASDGNTFYLVPYKSSLLKAGEGANRPWLQQAGDPVTTVAWQSWVELNSKTARNLGIGEGDVIEVRSSNGAIRVPAYPYEGIRPDTVAIPAGQGHERLGRYARNRGANPLSILEPEYDPVSGQLAWMETRVQLKKTGRTVEMAKFEGSDRDMGRDVIRLASASGVEKPITRMLRREDGDN